MLWKHMGETLMHIAKWNKQAEKVTQCMILTMWHSRKGKACGDSEVISEGPGLWGGNEGWLGGAQGLLRQGELCCLTL